MKDFNSDVELRCRWCEEKDAIHILQRNHQDATDIVKGWLIACTNCGKVTAIGDF